MSTKIPPSSFCLGQLLMDMGPFQSVANIFSASPLENTNFPSANGLPVVDSFVKNWTLCPLTTFSTGTLSRLTLVQVLCMLLQTLSSYVHWSSCVQMTLFAWLILLTLTIFLPPILYISLYLEGRDLMKPFHLGLHVSKLLTLYMGLL